MTAANRLSARWLGDAVLNQDNAGRRDQMEMSEHEELEEAIETLGRIETVFQLLAEIDEDPSFLQPKRPPRKEDET
jgi:hypothetical protein